MRTSEVATLLDQCITNHHNILLVGSPGVGKSDLIGQSIARCNNVGYWDYPALQDTTDPGGIPWPSEKLGYAIYLFKRNIRELTEPEGPEATWVLDDLGQGTPSVQAGYMQWLLAGGVNDRFLRKNVTIVAATNRREDRANVYGLLEPVKSRFVTIVAVDPHIIDWCEWAVTCRNPVIPHELIAFLRLRPDLLCKFAPTAEMENSPNPRTWVNVAKNYWLKLSDDVRAAAYQGAVGPAAADEWMAFLQLYKSLVSLDQIIADPMGSPVPTKNSELYAISAAIGHYANKQNLQSFVTYLERMVPSGHSDIAGLAVSDMTRRDPMLVNTGAYVKMASGPLGRALYGEVR